VNKSGKPQPGADVTLDNKKVKSDKTGVASFARVSAGNHTVKALGATKQINVKETGKPTEVQQFNIAETESAASALVGKLPLIVGGIAVLALAGYVFTKKPWQGSGPKMPPTSGIVTGGSSGPSAPISPTSNPSSLEPMVVNPNVDQKLGS
jgi:hypothetical protein